MHSEMLLRSLIKYRFLIWFAATAIQAFLTPLIHDEAYYWTWSLNPAWGYFDHPPMIALLIKAGTLLGHSFIEVRVLIILMNLAFIWLLEKMIQPVNVILYWKILLSIAVFQLGGFIAVPDMPLLFFALLFFFSFKKYLDKQTLLNASILAICSALMLYSKYHGILVIGFSFMAFPKLWLKKNTIAFIVLCTLLFTPHLWWQYENNFVTPQYHFLERSGGNGFSIANVFNYLLGQAIFTGPLIGVFLLFLLFKSSYETDFEKALKYSGIGIFLFFFLMSFKGRAEANWTNVAFIPLLYFGYKSAQQNIRLQKAFTVFFVISFPLINAARVIMINDSLSSKIGIINELHGWKEWANAIKEKANGTPVVMIGSYQKASKYIYYTGREATAVSNVVGRRSQFDIWMKDTAYYNKKALVLLNWEDKYKDAIATPKGTEYCSFIDTFVTYSPVRFTPASESYNIKQGDTLVVNFELSHRFKNLPNITINSSFPPYISCQFYKEGKIVDEFLSDFYLNNSTFSQKNHSIHIPTNKLQRGKYEFRLSVSANWLPAFVNCKKIKLTVN